MIFIAKINNEPKILRKYSNYNVNYKNKPLVILDHNFRSKFHDPIIYYSHIMWPRALLWQLEQ